MAAPQNFRSALNGFNREDVVHYLEYLNAKHANELNQLRVEKDVLQAEVELLRFRPAAAPAASGDADELRQQIAQLEQEKARLQAALDQANAQKEAALTQAQQATDNTAEELEAYRRAERVERVAKERAAQVYQQANGALADASAKVDQAAAQINDMVDQVADQLTTLQGLVVGSKQILQEAAASLYAIRPEKE